MMDLDVMGFDFIEEAPAGGRKATTLATAMNQ
jgi:hypothetical protein